jgi:hypothetical protein
VKTALIIYLGANIIRRHIDNRKLLLICILLLSYTLVSFSCQYLVVFLFNTVMYVCLLLGVCILIEIPVSYI